MPTYVIYARKSTESEDKQVLSIDSQIAELKAHALKRGVAVDEVLTEARSAKAPGRPVFGDLMRRIRRGQIAGVLCWKMDRLARNHLDHGAILQALADGHIKEVITSDRVYTADGNDRFLGNFEFGIATKFIDDLRQNVKRGNRARFQQGWPNYRPPAGYLEDRATKTIIKDPVNFDLIRRAWDLLLSGATPPRKILKILNEEWGYRSRKTPHGGMKPMSFSGLYGLFTKPYYMGLIRLKNGDSYKGSHVPMLTEEEFARAQEILGRAGRQRPVHHEFAFSGLLRCASCGRAMVGEVHVKPNGKAYVYYRCHRRGQKTPCTEPTLPESALTAQISAEMAECELGSEMADWIRENLTGALRSEASQLHTVRDSVERAVKQARSEEDTLLSLRLRGSIDDALYERRRAEISDRRATLELRLERPAPNLDSLLERIDRVLEFAQNAPTAFREGPPVLQRQILETIGSNYRVTQRKALYDAKKPFTYLKAATPKSHWCTIVEDVRTWLLDSQDTFTPALGADSLLSVARPREAA
jgi:DNA invertase Pin-like site-specific DNA recombinase